MNEIVTETLKVLCRTSPAAKRRILVTFYDFLARRFDRPDWTFMNYGYANTEAGRPVAVALSGDDEGERYCAQLYHHVAAAVPLAGRDVLEVGCGRGGGCAYITRHLHAATTTGLDLAPRNIALCRTRYDMDGVSFVEGDALNLPFPDGRFDAIVNIESSHCYPSVPAFLREAGRVLRDGGHLLFADLRTPQAMDRLGQEMHRCGMVVVEEQDISRQVVCALDADSARKAALIDESVPWLLRPSFREFPAVKGSGNYAKFKAGRLLYRRFVLQKADGVEPGRGAGGSA